MKKLGLICLAIVMVLGTMGVGYAMWSDAIAISGTVQTGAVSIKFEKFFTQLDPKTPPPPYVVGEDGLGHDWTIEPGQWGSVRPLEKNVGYTNVTWIDEHHVSVTLNNVYPCYYNNISLHVSNDGTIPVKVHQPSLTFDPGTGSVTIPLPRTVTTYITGPDQYGGTSPVVELYWMHAPAEQIHPGDIIEYSFGIHVLQAAMQDHTYTFVINMQADQWNEFVSP